MRKNEEIFKVVLEKSHKNVKSVDCIGLTSLHVYSTGQFKSLLMKECDILVKAGADVDARINFDSPIWPGYTPSHFATWVSMFGFMLSRRADPCAKDANGVTPLDLQLEIYEPSNVVHRLRDDNNFLESIRFQNNLKLSKVLDDVSNFGNTDPNTAIPLESPLWPGATLLHVAVKLSQDDAAKVESFLRKGASLTIQDANGMTALHLAFHSRKRHCIDEILKAHVNTLANPVDSSGLSHFHIACITGNRKIVEMFLMAGKVDPNVTLKTDAKPHYPVIQEKSGRVEYPEIKAGSTPLHIAVITSAPWLAGLLLQNGADPDRPDADGLTWMHRIFGYKSSGKFIKTLALPQVVKSNSVVTGGLSHLHVACCAGSENAVRELLPLLGNPDEVNRPIGNEVIDIFGELPDGLCFGDTPLHLASRTRSMRVVDLLLENGADLGAKNADGLSPLHVALVDGGSLIIRRLASEYSKREMWPDEIGLTQLHIACALKDVPMIEELLESGENVNSQIKKNSLLWPGDTPMHILIRKNYPIEGYAIQLLLRYIINDIERAALDNQPLHASAKRQKMSPLKSPKLPVNLEGISALHVSCMLKDLSIVEKFMELGVDFETPKDYLASEDPGFYPLHLAVKYSTNEIVEFMLKHKVSIDSQDICGDTPSHVAASCSNGKLLLLLKANDFDVTKKNVFGRSVMNVFLRKMKCQDKFDYTSNLLKNGLAENIDLTMKTDLIEKLATEYNKENFKLLFKHIPDVSDIDEDGRNIFYHLNLSRSFFYEIPSNIFIRIAEELINSGCELDHRDKTGQTALHHAVLAGNLQKVKTLLFVGADINVTDINGETSPNRSFECRRVGFSVVRDMVDIFYDHLYKLKLANLYVCRVNEIFYEVGDSVPTWQGSTSLNSMKEQMITKTFSLRDVLTEGMVTRFPIMSEYQSQAILKTLDSDDLKKNYPRWLPLFNMQRRKALRRKYLYQEASSSLQGFLDPRLPQHCIQSITMYLSIEDWQNVISAVDRDGK